MTEPQATAPAHTAAAAAVAPRFWVMHGHRNERQPGEYLNVSEHPFTAAMYGDNPIPLIVTEDPDGTYLGWIDTDDTELVMVQWHTIFDMQFPYGVQAELDRGKGEVVRVSITDADPDNLPSPACWAMWAHHADTTDTYLHIHTRRSRTARYSSTREAIPVTVTPDPDGPYLGWVETGTTTPTKIARAHIFDASFTYGHQAEADRGKGRAIALTITPGHPGAPQSTP